MGVAAALGAGEAEREVVVGVAVREEGAADDVGGPFAQADLDGGCETIFGADAVADLLILFSKKLAQSVSLFFRRRARRRGRTDGRAGLVRWAW